MLNQSQKTTLASLKKAAFFAVITLFGISSMLYAQTQLIEEVARSGDEILIPYQKFELENQ